MCGVFLDATFHGGSNDTHRRPWPTSAAGNIADLSPSTFSYSLQLPSSMASLFLSQNGDNCSPVSLSPAINLSPESLSQAINCSPVSTTPAINCIDDRGLLLLQIYLRPPKSARAADIVIGTAMKTRKGTSHNLIRGP